jgi:hypothetical protein
MDSQFELQAYQAGDWYKVDDGNIFQLLLAIPRRKSSTIARYRLLWRIIRKADERVLAQSKS